MTATLTTLGKILTTDEGRDAIHIAVIPMIAGETMAPGVHCGLVTGGTGRAVTACDNPIGIVDPFLRVPVKVGERFWLFLYPNTITSLRHEWTHPALDKVYSESEQWIRDFAARVPLDYHILMQGADDYVRSKGYDFLCFGGLLEGEYVPDEFWPHYERVTGKSVAKDERGSFFSCSC